MDNDPPPAVSGNDPAIAPRDTSTADLVSDDFPVFHWQHDAKGSYSRATAADDH